MKVLQGKKEELAGIGSGKVIDRYTRLIVIVPIVVGFNILKYMLSFTNVAFVHTKLTCNCQQQNIYLIINMPIGVHIFRLKVFNTSSIIHVILIC